MERIRTYELEGLVLNVPLRYDKQSERYIEDYSELIENPRFTLLGSPIMFAGEDACALAEEATPGGCPDCGSCRFYERAGDRSWIGLCKHEKKTQQHSPENPEPV